MAEVSMETDLVGDAQRMLVDAKVIVARHEERAIALGENFNLFELLGVGHYEVTTHSRFIAELLDPQGSHGQGDVFLQEFLEVFGLSYAVTLSSASVSTEYYLGPKTEKSGGYIDILILDGAGNRIVIENKIYAQDQENWVTRCADFLPTGGTLIYLTLEGRGVSDRDLDSKNLEDQKVKLDSRSYATDVVNWIGRCHAISAGVPILRETLAQYLNLVKNLTHQNSSNKMEDELVELALKDLKTFFSSARAESAVKYRLISNLNQALKDAASKLDLPEEFEWKSGFGDSSQKSALAISTPEMDKENVWICFSFEKRDWREFIFGITYADSEKSTSLCSILRHKFDSIFPNGQSSHWWPAFAFHPNHRNWEDEEFIMIQDGRMAAELSEKVVQLYEIFVSAKGRFQSDR